MQLNCGLFGQKSGGLLVQNADTVFGGLYAYLKNLNFSSFLMMPKFFAVFLVLGVNELLLLIYMVST